MSIALDPPRWQAVSELFDEALELSTTARPAFLDRACAEGSELRAAVEAMIAADQEAVGFLEQPAVERIEAAAVSRIGERIGAFRLVREIGRGGMGEVYLGERDDGQFEQRVAIKLIQAGPASERPLRDFLRERRILARLEHPHIARLLDGGMTTDGHPYLVMEHIKGEAITTWCETKRLPLEDRLRLFLGVCEAVEAAHRAQVVHRDLKPSNILVDRQGNVKLLDFGVARILDGESDATRAALPLLTPLYAAPEQIRGELATVATDVYALGLLLHEILTGMPAHRVRLATPEELIRAVVSDEPEPPSAAAARRQREREAPAVPPRRLRGDLDRIVLQALQKEPARRYPSAAALAGDLRRHLAGLPVTARAGGLAYRTAKLLRRRRLEMATLTAALALAAGLVMWQGRDVPAARPLRFQLLSTFGGSHQSPSLSPDGRRFAFVQKDGRGVPQIWMKDLVGGDPAQLTHGGDPVRRPCWSPLNDQIVFDVPGHGIWSLPLGGGTPRQILREGFNANLSRDGRRLVYETETAVWTAAVDGSGARRLIDESFNVSMRTPAFSPDGRWVVFFAAESGPYGDLWVIPSSGGEARRLTHDVATGGDPVWTADGRWIVYASDRGGAMNLWRVRSEGGIPEPVTEGAGEDTEPDLSADGRRLIYTSSRNTFALVWLDPRTGERRNLLERNTSLVHPSVSPRGDRVAFFAPLGPRSNLWTIGAHGEDLRQVTDGSAGFEVMPDWSGDGRSLFFYEMRRAFFGKIAAAGGPSQVLVPGWKFERQHGAHVDSAGRRIAYSNLRGNSPATTRIRDLASGRETRIAEPLRWPRWSPGGQWLAGRANDGRLLLCPASGGSCRTLSPNGAEPRWTRAGQEIYFVRYPGQMMALAETIPLLAVRPDGTGERQVAELSGVHPMHFFFDAAPGGEVVWTEWRPSQQQLWQAELPFN